MVLKATIGGIPIEIWFTPSFNIKTTDKRIELLLRGAELEVFDPWELRKRNVKATKSLRDAYLLLDEYRLLVPEAGITFESVPELPNAFEQSTEEYPVVH